jgi:hypothetical protein
VKGGLLELATVAVFRGGPLDGRRLDVEPSRGEYVCYTWDGSSLRGMQQVAAVKHRYRRSPDRLRDGAAEFLYVSVEGTA